MTLDPPLAAAGRTDPPPTWLIAQFPVLFVEIWGLDLGYARSTSNECGYPVRSGAVPRVALLG